MQVKIFYGLMKPDAERDQLEWEVNSFLENLPNNDILKVDSVGLSSEGYDNVAVLVWLKTTQKTKKEA